MEMIELVRKLNFSISKMCLTPDQWCIAETCFSGEDNYFPSRRADITCFLEGKTHSCTVFLGGLKDIWTPKLPLNPSLSLPFPQSLVYRPLFLYKVYLSLGNTCYSLPLFFTESLCIGSL